MKICYFTENYYKGGLDTFLINLLNAWPDLNDHLTLMCNSSHPGIEVISQKVKRQIEIIKYSRFFTSSLSQGKAKGLLSQMIISRIFFISLYRILQYPILFPWYVFTLAMYFRKTKYDRLMVVNGGYPASLLCRCAAIAWRLSGKKQKCLFNFHNFLEDSPWYFRYPEYIVDKAVIKSCSYIVSVSKNCLNSLKRRAVFSDYKSFVSIYNGIEEPVTKSNQNINVEKKALTNRYILMLATYEERKGHGFLLEAFKHVVNEIPDLRLEIYGYGKDKERQRVANKVKVLNLENVVSLNDFAINTIDLIKNSLLLVVPSQSYESFGLTIIEAMALGIPVVATDVGGIPEVLQGSDAGIVCSKTDINCFANAITTIVKNPALADGFGKNGRQTYENKFTASKMAQQYHSLLI